jgi:ornithine carbamoyltransferase
MARHFLRDDDLAPDAQAAVLDLAAVMEWDEEENRLHTQKALLAWLMERQ